MDLLGGSRQVKAKVGHFNLSCACETDLISIIDNQDSVGQVIQDIS
jgi:hypothetical protein